LRVALGTASRADLYTQNSGVQKVDVYPNPATSAIKVNLTGFEGKSEITLMDVNGKAIMRRQVSAMNSELDISRLPAGIYLLSVKNNGVEVSSTKIVKSE